MSLPPLVERELRAALRKNTAKLRFWAGLGGVVFTLVMLSFHTRSPGNGQTLFQYLLILSSVCVVQTIHFSLDLVAMERRNGTLGLLVLTGLSPGEIFVGKLLGLLLVQLSTGIALLPCFAVCFLIGGVPAKAFLAAAVLIPNLTMLTLAVSLTASTLAKDEDGAMWVALLLGCLICLPGPAAFEWIASGTINRGWLLTTPVHGILLVWDFFTTGSSREFWLNSVITAGYWLMLIGIASWILRTTWSEEKGPWGRVLSWSALERRWAWLRNQSASPPRRWLLPNPYVWLALRDRRSVSLAWAAVCGIMLLWFAGFLLWPRVYGSVLTTICVGLLVFGAVGVMAMFSAAKRASEDRRTGALELLLTTPLPVSEIIEGQSQAIQIGFRRVYRFVIGCNLVLALTAFYSRTWDILAALVFLECWALLACAVIIARGSSTGATVVWAALNSARPLFVVRKVVCPPGAVIALVFGLYQAILSRWSRDFPVGGYSEFIGVSVVLIGAAVMASFALLELGGAPSRHLKKNFRWVAQQPLPEPTDPRFRRWDPTRPFPEPRPFF